MRLKSANVIPFTIGYCYFLDYTYIMETPAITEYSTLASPLDHVFRHVPKAHEKALRQAVYNVIAAATLGGICFAAYYVQVVLEPFIMPMIWALLTGFVIHPYKTQLADRLRNQLRR